MIKLFSPFALSHSLHISPTRGLWLLKEVYCDFIGKPIGNNLLYTSQHNNILPLLQRLRESSLLVLAVLVVVVVITWTTPTLGWTTPTVSMFPSCPHLTCHRQLSRTYTRDQESSRDTPHPNTDHKDFIIKAPYCAFVLNCLGYDLLWSPQRVSYRNPRSRVIKSNVFSYLKVILVNYIIHCQCISSVQ